MKGCAAFGAKFYRVSGWGGEAWYTCLKEARSEIVARKRDGAIGALALDRVTLSARMTPKQLALALLNADDSAFATVERVQP
ncbi:MAG: hypothetical protein QGG14_01470 [Planctomycetota bacterium]|jgi:hypothetical protein|nr:hypothetical protein [Planctomycetota bacterium]